jgi:hypothetical protein
MTRNTAPTLQHSLASHLYPCPVGVNSNGSRLGTTEGIRASPQFKIAHRIPSHCNLAYAFTWRCGQRLHGASPSLALPTEPPLPMTLSVMADCGDTVLLKRTEYGGEGQLVKHSCPEAAQWTVCMLRTTRGSCLNFLLAEHLRVRGVFIYLAQVSC